MSRQVFYSSVQVINYSSSCLIYHYVNQLLNVFAASLPSLENLLMMHFKKRKNLVETLISFPLLAQGKEIEVEEVEEEGDVQVEGKEYL